jgi:hypothetical protein
LEKELNAWVVNFQGLKKNPQHFEMTEEAVVHKKGLTYTKEGLLLLFCSPRQTFSSICGRLQDINWNIINTIRMIQGLFLHFTD